MVLKKLHKMNKVLAKGSPWSSRDIDIVTHTHTHKTCHKYDMQVGTTNV